MALTGADFVDPVVAHIACSTFAFLYVAGFYIFRSPDMLKLSRDHPQVMKARIRSVMVASVVIPFIVWLIIPEQRQYSLPKLLGIFPPHPITGTFGPLLLLIILFFGPLVQRGYEHALPFQSDFNFYTDVVQVFTSLIGQRNFIVAPFTEEFVFRACIIPVLYYARFSRLYLILVSPMYFGLAHLHHIIENYRQYGANKRALKMAVLTTAFQFVYTTVFGWFVSFVFLRTANIWSPILCHVFCNLMGFPRMEDIAYRKPNEQKVIWSAYVAGALLFIWCLYPLTNPVEAGSFYWIQQ